MKTPILLLALALLCAGALASPLAGGNGQVNAIGGSDQITTESRSLTVPCYPPSSLLFEHGDGTWTENANHYIPILDQFRSAAYNLTKYHMLGFDLTVQYLMDFKALTCYESHRNYTVYDEQEDVVSNPSMHYIRGMQFAYSAISSLLRVSRGDYMNDTVMEKAETNAGNKGLDNAFREFALIDFKQAALFARMDAESTASSDTDGSWRGAGWGNYVRDFDDMNPNMTQKDALAKAHGLYPGVNYSDEEPRVREAANDLWNYHNATTNGKMSLIKSWA